MKFNKKLTKSLRKCRKAIYNAKGKVLTKLISSPLSKDLKSTYDNKLKRFPVRTGDTVRVFTGQFKNREGLVIKVNRILRKIHVEGCDQQEGEKTVSVNIDPSNCRIIKFGEAHDRLKLVEKKLERISNAQLNKKLVE